MQVEEAMSLEIVFLDPRDPAFRRLVTSIVEDLQNQRVVMLLGAGVSNEPPSNLPLARQLQTELQDVIWQAAELAAVDLNPPSSDLVAAERVVRQARLERLLDALYQTHGQTALDYISVLNGKVWNENHAVVAALAEAGLLPECITLNFDLLIEEALRARGCACATVCPLAGKTFIYGSGNPRLRLLKPHGSFAPESVSKDPYNLLSATLSQIGSEPVAANLRELQGVLSRRPVLLVAGYSDDDWDIYPILLRFSNLIRRVIWVEYAPDHNVVSHQIPDRRSLRERVLPWLQNRSMDSVLAVGNVRQLLRATARMLDDAVPLKPQAKSETPRADASMFMGGPGSRDLQAMRTMVALGYIIGETGPFSASLLGWLRRQPEVKSDARLACLVEDLLGHTAHTRGHLHRAIRHTENVIHIKRGAFEATESAPDIVWLGYEYLCLLKRPNPLRPWDLFMIPLRLLRGYHLMCLGIRLAAAKDKNRLVAMRTYYIADLLHSWGNMLMLGGPWLVRQFRWLFKRVCCLYDKAAAQADFMDTGYYWLRHVEAQLLAGGSIDRKRVEFRLSELERSNQLTQNHVQAGNVAAYRALLVFLLDGDKLSAERYLEEAEREWAKIREEIASGSRRLVLFRRFVGVYGLWSSVWHFLRRAS